MARLSHTHIVILLLLLDLAAAASALAGGAPPHHPAPEFSLGAADPPQRRVAPAPGDDSGSGDEEASERLAAAATFSFTGGALLKAELPAAAPGSFRLLDASTTLAGKEEAKPVPGGSGAGGDGGGWRYKEATVVEYTAVSLATAGAAYSEFVWGEPDQAKWKARNGFDESIRDALRLGSSSARDAAHIASNAIMGLLIGAPVLEPLGTLGFRDRRWDVVWQTEMVNAESIAFTSLVSSVTQNLIARERPFVRNCSGGVCEGVQENRSMPSGHVAFDFTGAGLLCNHHRYQSIYEDPAIGRAVCATGIGLAVADGFLRIMSDRHYATDVLAGSAIGLFSGFLLPRLVHYWHPRELPERKGENGKEPPVKLMAVTPQVQRDGASLSCDFRF